MQGVGSTSSCDFFLLYCVIFFLEALTVEQPFYGIFFNYVQTVTRLEKEKVYKISVFANIRRLKVPCDVFM